MRFLVKLSLLGVVAAAALAALSNFAPVVPPSPAAVVPPTIEGTFDRRKAIQEANEAKKGWIAAEMVRNQSQFEEARRRAAGGATRVGPRRGGTTTRKAGNKVHP